MMAKVRNGLEELHSTSGPQNISITDSGLGLLKHSENIFHA